MDVTQRDLGLPSTLLVLAGSSPLSSDSAPLVLSTWLIKHHSEDTVLTEYGIVAW